MAMNLASRHLREAQCCRAEALDIQGLLRRLRRDSGGPPSPAESRIVLCVFGMAEAVAGTRQHVALWLMTV